MKYNRSISFFAEIDLLDAMVWYELQRKGLSEEFEQARASKLLLIKRSPRGFQVRYDDVRVAFTDRFPYGIHYIVENNEITVIGIYHVSRDPKSWIERRKEY